MASPAPLPLWTFWVQALSVPALAAVGAIIAFQQMSIARTKLQHDLFDRRVEVYSAIRAALTYIEDCGDVTWEGLSRLHTATSVVPFLFPRRFTARIRDIERKARDLFHAQRSLQKLDDRLGHDRQRETLLSEVESLRTWLSERLAMLSRTFEPYLRIGPT